MSHDHLQCDHQMMRRHDTNLMDGMNPDVKMMNRPVNHRMKGDPTKVCLMKI